MRHSFQIATDRLARFLSRIASRNAYNPVRDWIQSKPWDGRERVSDLYATLRLADPKAIHARAFRVWLRQIVAAAFSDTGILARGVLTLLGPQSIGKSRWFKSLLPDGLVLGGFHLQPADRDSVAQAVSFALVELGELDGTFRKADMAALKAFLGRDSDTFRLPFARKEERYPRRTVFGASVNDANFLIDPTGNSRWWTFELTGIDAEHSLDVQQVFAEVYEDWKSEPVHWLTLEETRAMEAASEQYRRQSGIVERLHDWLDTDSDKRDNKRTWGDITAKVHPRNRSDEDALRAELQRLTGQTAAKNGKKAGSRKVERLWFLPPERADEPEESEEPDFSGFDVSEWFENLAGHG